LSRHLGGDFKLWTELAKGKPVFIFTEATQNTFDYIFDLTAKECLYDLFKGDVTFYHHTFDVRWDHDYGSNCEISVPEVWRNHPLKTSLPHSGYQYPILQEAWDAEIRDWGIMRYPVKSVPILKDRHGYNSVRYGMPVKSDYFFDVNGIQCNVGLSRGGGRYSLKDSMPFHTYANKGLIPATSYVHTYTSQLRLKIMFLKIMEALDWQYDADSELLKTYYKECLGKLMPYQDIGLFEVRNGIVEAIDRDANTVSVKGKVWKLKNAKEEVHVLDMGKTPRVCYENEEGVWADGRIADVARGDKVHALYQLTHGADSKRILRSLMVGEKAVSHLSNYDMLWLSRLFWVTGRITAIDNEKGMVTVSMPKPDVAKGEWIGYRYWQHAMDRLGTKLPERGRTRSIYLTGKPMLDGGDDARMFNLVMDSAVEMSVNGVIQYDLSGIKVGDKTVFSFNMDGIKNTHPVYRPWHLMVVTKDKLIGIPIEAGRNE
jgi:hypothetical protein